MECMTRRSLFTSGLAGLALASLPNRVQAASRDAILDHITSELVRAHKDIKRNNFVRSEHLRTLSANVRLLVIHSRTTLHLDEQIQRNLKNHLSVPALDHGKLRRELERFGIDPDTVVINHPDQATWNAFLADTTPVTDRLITIANNLDVFAAALVQQEAMDAAPRIVHVQSGVRQRDSMNACPQLIWNVRVADTAAAWACGVIVAPELCAGAIVLASALWATAYFAGCA